MTFTFRLQSILDIKLGELEVAELEETRVRKNIAAIEKSITGIRDAYLKDRDELNARIINSDFKEIALFESSMNDKKDRIMALLRLLNDTKHLLADCQQITLALRKKTTSLEKMKHRKALEYEKHEEKKLQLEIDNRSSLAAWKRNQNGEQL